MNTSWRYVGNNIPVLTIYTCSSRKRCNSGRAITMSRIRTWAVPQQWSREWVLASAGVKVEWEKNWQNHRIFPELNTQSRMLCIFYGRLSFSALSTSLWLHNFWLLFHCRHQQPPHTVLKKGHKQNQFWEQTTTRWARMLAMNLKCWRRQSNDQLVIK